MTEEERRRRGHDAEARHVVHGCHTPPGVDLIWNAQDRWLSAATPPARMLQGAQADNRSDFHGTTAGERGAAPYGVRESDPHAQNFSTRYTRARSSVGTFPFHVTRTRNHLGSEADSHRKSRRPARNLGTRHVRVRSSAGTSAFHIAPASLPWLPADPDRKRCRSAAEICGA